MIPILGFVLTRLTAETSAPATNLQTLTGVFETIVGWVISFLRMISTEPLLLVGLAVLVVGLVAGLAFRMIRGRGRGR